MNSAKELLRNSIELLSEAEASQTLDFIQTLQKNSRAFHTHERLASDPAINVPTAGFRAFRVVKPLKVKGVSASRLLMDDRR